MLRRAVQALAFSTAMMSPFRIVSPPTLTDSTKVPEPRQVDQFLELYPELTKESITDDLSNLAGTPFTAQKLVTDQADADAFMYNAPEKDLSLTDNVNYIVFVPDCPREFTYETLVETMHHLIKSSVVAAQSLRTGHLKGQPFDARFSTSNLAETNNKLIAEAESMAMSLPAKEKQVLYALAGSVMQSSTCVAIAMYVADPDALTKEHCDNLSSDDNSQCVDLRMIGRSGLRKFHGLCAKISPQKSWFF